MLKYFFVNVFNYFKQTIKQSTKLIHLIHYKIDVCWLYCIGLEYIDRAFGKVWAGQGRRHNWRCTCRDEMKLSMKTMALIWFGCLPRSSLDGERESTCGQSSLFPGLEWEPKDGSLPMEFLMLSIEQSQNAKLQNISDCGHHNHCPCLSERCFWMPHLILYRSFDLDDFMVIFLKK